MRSSRDRADPEGGVGERKMREMVAEKYLGWVTDGPWGFRGEVFRQTLDLWPGPGDNPREGPREGEQAGVCGVRMWTCVLSISAAGSGRQLGPEERSGLALVPALGKGTAQGHLSFSIQGVFLIFRMVNFHSAPLPCPRKTSSARAPSFSGLSLLQAGSTLGHMSSSFPYEAAGIAVTVVPPGPSTSCGT